MRLESIFPITFILAVYAFRNTSQQYAGTAGSERSLFKDKNSNNFMDKRHEPLFLLPPIPEAKRRLLWFRKRRAASSINRADETSINHHSLTGHGNYNAGKNSAAKASSQWHKYPLDGSSFQ